MIKFCNLTTPCKMRAECLQMGLFDASLQFPIPPTPAISKLVRPSPFRCYLCRPALPASFICHGCEANASGHAEGDTGSCGMQMPSFRACLFSGGREVCRWSPGWRRAHRLGAGCCAASLLLRSPPGGSCSDEFVSFRSKADNKDVAKSCLEPAGGAAGWYLLAVEVGFVWPPSCPLTRKAQRCKLACSAGSEWSSAW